jgi:L-malate glycosyltransferase
VAARPTLVHIVPSLKVGGQEMLLLRLAARQKQTWEVHVVCLDELGPLALRLRQSGAVVHNLDGLTVKPWQKLARLVRLLQRLRPRIVHSHNPASHLYAVLAHPLVRPSALVHTRHGQQRMLRTLAPLVNRLSARWTAATIAVSEDVAAMVQRLEGFPAARCVVLRNGVDTSIYKHSRGPLHHAIMVGRLDSLKDHATALRATAAVVARHPNFRLRIVGDGDQRDRLLALRAELGLERHVELMGTRNDIPRLLAESGMFVISSISEGVPLALLEAMASHLPIVTTKVGGIPEVLDNARAGVLVPPGDPAALADAICGLIDEPRTARHLADEGWRIVTSGFTLERLAEHYESIYEQALTPSIALAVRRRELNTPTNAQ